MAAIKQKYLTLLIVFVVILLILLLILAAFGIINTEPGKPDKYNFDGDPDPQISNKPNPTNANNPDLNPQSSNSHLFNPTNSHNGNQDGNNVVEFLPHTSPRDKKEQMEFNNELQFLEIYSLFVSVVVQIEPNDLFLEDPHLENVTIDMTNMPEQMELYDASYVHRNFKFNQFQKFRNKVYKKLINLNLSSPILDNNICYNTPLASYTMNKNTCFCVSMLYMIKQNKMLLKVIKTCSKDKTYYNNLNNLLNQRQGYTMTQQDLNDLTGYQSDHITPNFLLGLQADAVEVLETILSMKCDSNKLNFQFGGYIHVDGNKTITDQLPEQNTFSLRSISSEIPIFSVIPPTIGEFDIQKVFAPQKVTNGHLVPLFFNSPPFLVINITPLGANNNRYVEEKVDVETPIDFDENNNPTKYKTEKQSVYKIPSHANCIIHEEITIYSVNEAPTKYKLTGFLVYQAFLVPGSGRPSGHYIPFFKDNGQWFGNYYEFRGQVPQNTFGKTFKFKNDDTRFISSLYYERV